MPSPSPAQRLQRIARNLSRIFLRRAPSPGKPTRLRVSKPLLLLAPLLLFAAALLYRRLLPAAPRTPLPPAFDAPPADAAHPLRVVLVVPPFTHRPPHPNPSLPVQQTGPYDRQSLRRLLRSLAAASFDGDSVHLHIVLAPVANATAFALLHADVASFSWTHGPHTILNATSGGLFDLFVTAWSPARGDTQAALLLDASRVPPLPANFYRYLKSARRVHAHADVAGFALHPVSLRRLHLLPTTRPVLLYQNLPHVPAFSPASPAVWRAFQRWFFAHRGEWFLWPTVVAAKDKKDASWDRYRGTARANWTLWFSRFCAEYDLYTVYPTVDRPEPLPPVGRASAALTPQRFDFDGRHVSKQDTISEENLNRIVALGRRQGGSVSLTVVNDAFLETARSWICNVDVARIRPPGVVWITTDNVAYEGLKNIGDSYAVRMSEFQGGQSRTGTSYGTPGYWLLMLERTLLIRAILERGIGVFLFETDQVWLRDPVPFVKRLTRSGDEVDVVGTLDTRHEIGGNFLYLNPTLATRRIWREVCRRFEKAYHDNHMDRHTAKFRRYMENDQSSLTKLIFFDEAFKARNPTVFRALDTELFVDGRWYDKSRKYYTSAKSKSPIVVNNNFLIGIANKKQRAVENGHWFLTEGKCNEERVRKAVRDNEARGSIRTEDGAIPERASRIEGVDVEAELDEAVAAIERERQSQ